MMRDSAQASLQASPVRTVLRRVSRSLVNLKEEPKPNHSSNLNFDVLAHVMEYFEAGDLLRAMSTCRTLYQVGIPVLLRDVQLLGPEKTRKRRYALYRRHLLKDPARFSCVMSLACSYSALDKQTRNWYLALPRNFKSLRALTVDMETNTLNSSLSRWILSQKFLRELRLQNVGMQVLPVMDLMQRLKDNLEVFEIQMVFLHGLEGSFDPILGLLNSSHSLRSLFIECYDYRNGPVIRLDPHLRYPAVQELRWTSSQSVQTAALVKTFPSLRKLHIMHTSFDDFISMLISGALTNGALLELRRSNYDAQHCRHARWTSLDLLQGGILTLWTLALRCCVIRLETTLRGRNEKVGHLLFVLHDTWPEQLMLSLFPTHVADLDRVLNFPSLQALDLTIPIFRKPDLQGVLKQLEEAITQVYSSRLRRVTVTIQMWFIVLNSRAYRRALRRGEDRKWDPPPGSRSLPSRWRALVSGIPARLPLLEELKVELWGHQPFVWKRGERQFGIAEGKMAEIGVADLGRYEPPLCQCSC